MEGAFIDPDKVQAMLDWLTPKTLKALRGFISFTGYYKNYVYYGLVCKPLTSFLNKDDFQWDHPADEVFKELKLAMSNTPMLALLAYSQEFMVGTDTFNIELG